MILIVAVVQSYEWSCSSLDASNGRYTVPGLGDIGNVSVAITIGRRLEQEFRSDTSIFPVPSTLNCSGTVSALEFCYNHQNISAEFGTNYHVFTLLILGRTGTFTFNVRHSTIIRVYSTPTAQKCLDQPTVVQGEMLMTRYCCDSMQLDMADYFSLPATNIAFGITPTEFNQLRYRDESLQVVQYNVLSSDIQGRNSFTLKSSFRNDTTPRLLQFIISK